MLLSGDGGGAGRGGTEFEDAVVQLMSVLGDEITESRAARLVEMSGGDVNLAISLHFDSLAEGGGGGGGDYGHGDRPSGSSNDMLGSGGGAPRNAANDSDLPFSADDPQDPAGIDLLVAYEDSGSFRSNSNANVEQITAAAGSVLGRGTLSDDTSSPMRNGIRRPSAPAVEPTSGACPSPISP